MKSDTQMNIKDEVCARLSRMGIQYTRLEHARVSTIAECAAVEALMGGCVPRNLFLAPRNLSKYYLLIAHPASAFRTSSVSRQAGASRLAFAPEADIKRILRAHSGAVSPLGLMFDEARGTVVLIDDKLTREEWLIFHPCENDESIKMSSHDFFERFLPAVDAQPIFVNMEKSHD